MKFAEALKIFDVIVENGPLGTRLQYDYNFNLGPNMAKKAPASIIWSR